MDQLEGEAMLASENHPPPLPLSSGRKLTPAMCLLKKTALHLRSGSQEILLKYISEQDVVVHAHNPSTQDA